MSNESEINVGFDLGSSSIKIIHDNGQFLSPSVHGHRFVNAGDDVFATGKKALDMDVYPHSTIIFPIIKGKIGNNMTEATRLIRDNLEKVLEETPVTGPVKPRLSDINVVLGVPYYVYRSKDEETLKNILLKNIGVRKVHVVLQVFGTLIHESKKKKHNLNQSAIVVSMGHGTTEIMAFDKRVYVDGISLKKASAFLIEEIEKNEQRDNNNAKGVFLNHDLLHENADLIKPRIAPYMSEVANTIDLLKSQLRHDYKIVFCGGGIKLPGMTEAISATFPDAVFSKENIMSNALGLYDLANTFYHKKT